MSQSSDCSFLHPVFPSHDKTICGKTASLSPQAFSPSLPSHWSYRFDELDETRLVCDAPDGRSTASHATGKSNGGSNRRTNAGSKHDGMQSFKRFALHDLTPISTTIHGTPDIRQRLESLGGDVDAKVLIQTLLNNLDRYTPVDAELVLDRSKMHSKEDFSRVGQELKEEYTRLDDLLKSVFVGKKRDEFVFIILGFFWLRRWLLYNGRFLLHDGETANSASCSHCFALFPSVDLVKTDQTADKLFPQEGLSERDLATSCTLYDYMKICTDIAAISKRGKDVLLNKFSQNLVASLLSRNFHPMDVVELCKALGMEDSDVDYLQWRSQINLFRRTPRSAGGLSPCPLIFAHAFFHPFFEPIGIPSAIDQMSDTTPTIELWYQCAWFISPSKRWNSFNRLRQSLFKKPTSVPILPSDQKNRGPKRRRIAKAEQEGHMLLVKDSTYWLTSACLYFDRCPPLAMSYCFYLTGREWIHPCPPLNGLSLEALAHTWDGLPVGDVMPECLLTLPLAMRFLKSQDDVKIVSKPSHVSFPAFLAVMLKDEEIDVRTLWLSYHYAFHRDSPVGPSLTRAMDTIRSMASSYICYMRCMKKRVCGSLLGLRFRKSNELLETIKRNGAVSTVHYRGIQDSDLSGRLLPIKRILKDADPEKAHSYSQRLGVCFDGHASVLEKPKTGEVEEFEPDSESDTDSAPQSPSHSSPVPMAIQEDDSSISNQNAVEQAIVVTPNPKAASLVLRCRRQCAKSFLTGRVPPDRSLHRDVLDTGPCFTIVPPLGISRLQSTLDQNKQHPSINAIPVSGQMTPIGTSESKTDRLTLRQAESRFAKFKNDMVSCVLVFFGGLMKVSPVVYAGPSPTSTGPLPWFEFCSRWSAAMAIRGAASSFASVTENAVAALIASMRGVTVPENTEYIDEQDSRVVTHALRVLKDTRSELYGAASDTFSNIGLSIEERPHKRQRVRF